MRSLESLSGVVRLIDLAQPRALGLMRKKALVAGWEATHVIEGEGLLEVKRKVAGHFEQMTVLTRSVSLKLARGSERLYAIWSAEGDSGAWSFFSGGWCDVGVRGSASVGLNATGVGQRILGTALTMVGEHD